MTAAIVCSDLSFSWPDGAPVLSGLTVSFGPGRTGLIGVNGSGKSTLLRLIAGELRPGSGLVRARGEVGYLPQAIALGTRRTVSDLLGITAARDALHAIEAGETGEATWRRSGTTGMSRSEPAPGWTGWVSGSPASAGSASMTGWNGYPAVRPSWSRWPRCSCGGRTSCCWTSRPTTSTWTRVRRLYNAVASWSGVMVIVSHDRELLALVDQVADLSGGGIRMYGGNLAAYTELLAAEQAAAERAVTAAAADVRREQRDLVDAQVKQATRDRQGRKLAASGGTAQDGRGRA